MANNQNTIELDGVIEESLPNAMFRVVVDLTAEGDYAGRSVLCTLNGRMRQYKIRVMPGDKVKVEVTPYDKNRGRIIFRSK